MLQINLLNLRKFILSDRESAAYNDQEEFSKQYVITMMNLFYDQKRVIFSRDNNLIPIISNELARHYNEHGGKIALTGYFVFKTFSEFYKFASFELFNIETKSRLWDTEARLNEYFELINKFKSFLTDNAMDSLYDTFNEIVVKFGSDFRLYYLTLTSRM